MTHRSSGSTELDQKSPEYYGSFIILAHFSVKEYLTSDITRQGQAVKYSLQDIDCHVTLAKDCLAYLLHLDEVGSLPSGVFIEYPLALYVIENWFKHARMAQKRGYKLCQDFFLTKGEAFNNWIRLRASVAESVGLCGSVRLLLDRELISTLKAGRTTIP